MAPRPRKDETKSGLFSIAEGQRPFTVRVREEVRGGNLVYDYADPITGRRRKPSLGFGVRDERGRVDPDLAAEARELARIRSAELRLQKLRQETEPARITISGAFARYMDERDGGMPRSAERRGAYRRARAAWENRLGADTPWNQVTPAQVWAYAAELKEEGQVPKAVDVVKCLSAVYHWLRTKARVRGLENPVEGFDWERLQLGYEPRRRRFTREQLRALLAVRYQVDPRFALFLALSAQSVTRSVEVRSILRSQLDAPRPITPTRAQAPYGWIFFPGVKGQPPRLHFLTRFQREELFAAMYGYDDPATGAWKVGYLRELERRWRKDGTDYPLFPARRLRGGIKPVARRTAYTVIANLRPREWLHQAEKLAGWEPEEWRAWHAVRRALSDLVEEETDLATLTAVGGWTSTRTPEQIYLEKERYRKIARGRDALEHLFDDEPKRPRGEEE